MQNDGPTVFIVDDDAGVRLSTAMLLESANLRHQEYSSAVDFLDSYQPDQPGCLILDLHLPGMSGLDLVDQLRHRHIQLPILIVSGTGTVPLAVKGMKLGVLDFFVKPADPDLFIAKVQGAIELDTQRRRNAAELEPIRSRLASLTAREAEALQLLVTGLANKQIATQFGIAIKTVENHRASIMQKTGALNVADLTRMCMLMRESHALT